MDFREGDVVAGKYRVERVLGRGGMGTVVAARHIALGEPVAIKFLLREMLENQEALGRFLREARALARIKNEHVVRVSDVAELDDGAPYIVMEYLDGKDLSALLQARGVLPIEEAVDYVVQTCEAIAGAHALGIIHRDLKPSNLMLTTRSDGTPFIKVLDFGISKVTSVDASMVMTHTAAIMGSPYYMSPEQMTSARSVDYRSDIWSLGTILYELLTGIPPFRAPSLPGLALLVASTPHQSMRHIRPEIPVELDAVVSRCLAKQRDERFATVAELAAALSPFAPEDAAVSIRSSARILGSQPPKGSTSFRSSDPAPHSTAPVVRIPSDIRELSKADAKTMVRDDPSKKPKRAVRFAAAASVVAGIAVLGALAVSNRRHAATAVDPSRSAPLTAATPSTSVPPPLVPERTSPERRDDPSSTATKDGTHAPNVAPEPPARSKPPTAPTTLKPTSSSKRTPPRPPPASKPSPKQPESAYEHM